MPRQKRPLAEADPNVGPETSQPKKRARGKKTNNDDVSSNQNDAEPAAVAQKLPKSVEYLTYARPYFDFRDEKEEDDDFDSEDEDTMEELKTQRKEDRQKYSDKPIKDLPGYKWVVSKKGKDLLEKYALQFVKCDQDEYGLYIFNDWTPYGETEVIGNMVG
jgi:hypothetical protein